MFRKPTGDFDFDGPSRDLFITTAGLVLRVTPDFIEVDDGDETPVELWISEGWEPVAQIPGGAQ